MTPRSALASAVLLFLLSACSDDAPRVERAGPALRVVTLAPHLAELVFAAGAGGHLVGVSAYTDYPPAAAELPVISDAFTVDQEALRLLEPDLVLAWSSGMPASTIEKLRGTGLEVVAIETRGLDDIAAALRQIGALVGDGSDAEQAAAAFESRVALLRSDYGERRPVTVFYQVSSRPLYTINGAHFISELIEACGAINVFAGLTELAPAIDVEAVLAADPDAILALGPPGTLDHWQRFETLAANRYDNRVLLESSHLARASPRLDSAGREMCERIDLARASLPAR